MHVLGVDVVLVEEGHELLPLGLGQPDAQGAEDVVHHLEEDNVIGFRLLDKCCWHSFVRQMSLTFICSTKWLISICSANVVDFHLL